MKKKINVVAKLDYLPFFKKGDKAKIVSVLYTEDHLIHDAMYGYDNDVKVKICDKLIAPKGSTKRWYIELADGTVCPQWPSMRYSDYFEMV